MIGKRLGGYEVLAKLGEGGMGEVYRARDTKLHREVAIKVLPDLFAADPERLARFEREATTLATLNHPHIAQIYGVEESSGVRALVMELVEGEDLAQRIARRAIPLDEALAIARQIADALEAAHE
jgi:eukaryotic-like serine/threonine-protein kinase